MDKLQITGGIPLEGEVRISGAKNATLPILAGALLTEEPVVVGNVPHLQDVTTTIELLGRMGAAVTIDERMRIEVHAAGPIESIAPYELVARDRALAREFGRDDDGGEMDVVVRHHAHLGAGDAGADEIGDRLRVHG